jgi:hypothetical protein
MITKLLATIVSLRVIWGSLSGDSEDYCVLEGVAMYFGG